MSHLDVDSVEPYETCPYDPSHQILAFRMTWHLTRCERNHRNSNLVICQFNTKHRVPPAQLAEHLKHCDSRVDMEREMMPRRAGGVVANIGPRETNYDDGLVTDEWTAEADRYGGAGYDPSVAVARRNIMLVPKNMNKTQRKEYEKRERNRIQQERERRRREEPENFQDSDDDPDFGSILCGGLTHKYPPTDSEPSVQPKSTTDTAASSKTPSMSSSSSSAYKPRRGIGRGQITSSGRMPMSRRSLLSSATSGASSIVTTSGGEFSGECGASTLSSATSKDYFADADEGESSVLSDQMSDKDVAQITDAMKKL